MIRKTLLLALVFVLVSCGKPEEEPQLYGSATVGQQDIIVAVEAAGVIEPSRTVEVKSKASGEILTIHGETGDVIEKGTPLVEIDKRTPRNNLNQSRAELEAARARRSIAETQSERSKKLLVSRTINDVDYEQTILEFANAKAEVVRAQVAVENSRIALADADVLAPVTGTIIEKLVEEGQVISSPTMDVGGGTLLMKMANLSSVQVKTLVDETDIGKITPGQPVLVTVTAYPNQPFTGQVMKIEPQALAEQTVTTFSVLLTLENESGLLRPGMNADVEIRIAERLDVLAVPTIALKVDDDIPVAGPLVGLTAEQVHEQLGEEQPKSTAAPTDQSEGYRFSNQYWVFVDRGGKHVAVRVETGLTDLEYSEVISGLSSGDEVLLLPSSGLIRSQQRFQDQMRRFSGIPGMSSSKDEDKNKDEDKDKGK
jgi:HlyD family secretion protein